MLTLSTKITAQSTGHDTKMKITRIQLRQIINEEVIDFPSKARHKQMVDAFKTELISLYDSGDPSMSGEGFESWMNQVENAVKHIRDKSDIGSFNKISNDAEEMLMMGHFHPDNMFYGRPVRSG